MPARFIALFPFFSARGSGFVFAIAHGFALIDAQRFPL